MSNSPSLTIPIEDRKLSTTQTHHHHIAFSRPTLTTFLYLNLPTLVGLPVAEILEAPVPPHASTALQLRRGRSLSGKQMAATPAFCHPPPPLLLVRRLRRNGPAPQIRVGRRGELPRPVPVFPAAPCGPQAAGGSASASASAVGVVLLEIHVARRLPVAATRKARQAHRARRSPCEPEGGDRMYLMVEKSEGRCFIWC